MIKLVKDEYDGWHERISSEIDPDKGIKNELEREFKDSDSQPRREQIKITRDYWASERGRDTDAERTTFKAKGKTYVKTGENKFQSVDERDDVMYNDRTGTLFLLDENGDIKSSIDESDY